MSKASLKRTASKRINDVQKREKNQSGLDKISWHELSFFIEGLALARLPLNAATAPVTRKYSLGPRGTWILSLIAAGTKYPADLSDIIRISRALMTVELNRLTTTGLVTSKQNKKDLRRSELSLTPLGREASEQSRNELVRTIRRNLAKYSIEDIRLASRILFDVRRRDDGEISRIDLLRSEDR